MTGPPIQIYALYSDLVTCFFPPFPQIPAAELFARPATLDPSRVPEEVQIRQTFREMAQDLPIFVQKKNDLRPLFLWVREHQEPFPAIDVPFLEAQKLARPNAYVDREPADPDPNLRVDVV